MTWEIYLLSIIDNFRDVITAAIFLSVTAVLAWAWLIAISQDPESPGSLVKEMRPVLLAAICPALLLAALAITPTRKDIIESYVMVEGKQVLTAEKVEAVVERVDELVEKHLNQ